MVIADHVKCNWCDAEAYIPLGDDICPSCKTEGCLAWANNDEQEVEVYGYKIINIGGIVCK